jgi:hypothetical protein
VSVRLLMVCDAPGCDATAQVVDRFEELEPITGGKPTDAPQDFPQRLCLDTGWMDPPEGWRMTADGDRCPRHVDVDEEGQGT